MWIKNTVATTKTKSRHRAYSAKVHRANIDQSKALNTTQKCSGLWACSDTIRYLTNYSFFSSTNRLEPPLPQDGGPLGHAIKMARVLGSFVARTKLAIRKTACCRHDLRTVLPVNTRKRQKRKQILSLQDQNLSLKITL